MPADIDSLTVLIACHDRRDLTVRVVRQVLGTSPLPVRIVVVDDGSTDGTGEALRGLGDSRVLVIDGDGSLFWAASMALAESVANELVGAESSGYVWLNDDVTLDSDALNRLVDASNVCRSVTIGAVRDPQSGEPTYGGFSRAGVHPLAFAPVPPQEKPQQVDTLNGNLVLAPPRARAAIGPIEGGFAHALADIDYGLRAKKAGFPVVLAAGTFGACPRNPVQPRSTIRTDWARYRSRTGGGHPASVRLFLRRHAPHTWMWWIAWSHAAWWIRRCLRMP